MDDKKTLENYATMRQQALRAIDEAYDRIQKGGGHGTIQLELVVHREQMTLRMPNCPGIRLT